MLMGLLFIIFHGLVLASPIAKPTGEAAIDRRYFGALRTSNSANHKLVFIYGYPQIYFIDKIS